MSAPDGSPMNNNQSHPPGMSRMRASTQRPGSRKGPQPNGTAAQASRKVFNCICDDTALVAGVKKSTRNGIRQWVRNGQIRLFVPLHALGQLDRQKNASTKHGEDVRETLQWLDEVTSEYPNAVTLQGGFDTYEKWSEVERFTVPKTLFSENDVIQHEPGHEGLSEDLEQLTVGEHFHKESVSSVGTGMTDSGVLDQSASSHDSLTSPPTSPMKEDTAPARVASIAKLANSTASSSEVPSRFRPLFNYILWRIHQERDPVAALESFIFLCNDPNKVAHAKGFDIKVKRLEQLREAVSREDRDFKNRQIVSAKNGQSLLNPAAPAVFIPSTDDALEQNRIAGDSAVFTIPPKAAAAPPPSVLANKPPTAMDPDAFGRETQISHVIMPTSPQPTFAAMRGSSQPGFHYSPRGAHTSNAMPGGQQYRGGARGGAVRGVSRGNGGSTRGRGGISNTAAQQGPVIDPNSFTRPRSGGFIGPRGNTAGGRKLWVPS